MTGPSSAQRTDKPWGYELLWARTDAYVGKILHVLAGHTLSLQFHRRKDECMYLLSGEATLAIGPKPERFTLLPGQSFHIPAGVIHRLHAVTDVDLVEVSTPELDDIVRLADDYGRASVEHRDLIK